MDRVQGCNLNVVLLGDFNIDMQKSNPAWDSTISLFGLDQMITSPTRITPHSSTLIDHIYTSDTSIVSNILVPATGISDHFLVCCTLSVKTVKPVLNVHSSIVYRCFKQFDERAFLLDLHEEDAETLVDPAQLAAKADGPVVLQRHQLNQHTGEAQAEGQRREEVAKSAHRGRGREEEGQGGQVQQRDGHQQEETQPDVATRQRSLPHLYRTGDVIKGVLYLGATVQCCVVEV